MVISIEFSFLLYKGCMTQGIKKGEKLKTLNNKKNNYLFKNKFNLIEL